MKKSIKKERGITLIALIITIIILLILSGIAIATLGGKNGLFDKTKKSKEAQIEAEMKEQLNLALQDLQTEKLAEASLDDITQKWLTQKLSRYNPILKESTTEGKKVALQENGLIKQYLVDANLNVIEMEDKNGIEFSYEIKSREGGIANLLIKAQEIENGINKIECPNGNIVECYGTKKEKAIDYTIEVGIEYKFKIISVSGKEREEIILIEPEIITGEAYIGTSTTDTNSGSSVKDNSQIKGTTDLYINFTARLEKFDTECKIKLKDGIEENVLPYKINKNGIYIFIATGTYNGKTVTKTIEVKVNKYKSAKDIVKYDAGEWTYEDIYGIDGLNEKKLYSINVEKDYNSTFKLNDDNGINFTFGSFTYNGDTANASYINDGTIITSRNESVAPRNGYGCPKYDGWQILESKEQNGKTYITKIIHAGSPENFVFASYDPNAAEYLLSGGTRKSDYCILSNGTKINPRSWDMYKDKKQLNLIQEVHAMTYDEAMNISSNNEKIVTGSYYWLASAVSGLSRVYSNRRNL